ncbi:LLM class flavin-dependent oxidoreductase [Cytobacillus horneckiae]|uniref:LLM class flavin-dependent oxidoreductase n=1 Tax=Cytobacillus horneckiae TaxID=549687 RepID=A0A2N0ZJE9_9BACI|nr:LLM class flavin-dependent oxidoreductase [Cytobacillus horneckiae]MEC1154011.1 LLM class flavin-dependent oxidoreductase [Cytobacillus horneckiae]MED2938586.1 LLM class flavin-dependent oxidoreductase [Cytobacillus horneckiae]PKG29637.1 LLM class flavin-dependent oxidoreductase [Cytobacillus horneckiae]
MRLSILDQIPRPKGKSVEETIAETLTTVAFAETLGYERYWFAEHHGTKGMTSSSPEILMAAAAARTTTIHVGSGGILLPQYSPYKVASQLLQLQSLFPGRIDGGVGRSPGGNERIRLALSDRRENQLGEYSEKLEELIRFLKGNKGLQATPRTKDAPTLFSLGLGENSAKLAASLGIGYVFGHFINSTRGQNAHKVYRENFTAGWMDSPQALSAVFVICGESDEHAEELAASQDLWLLRTEKGLDSRIPSNEEAKTVKLREEDKKIILRNRRRMIIGDPKTVKEQLNILADKYQSNEWLILTNVYDFEEKRRSFERLASVF